MCFTLTITFIPCFEGRFFLIPIISVMMCVGMYKSYRSEWPCSHSEITMKHIKNVLDWFGPFYFKKYNLISRALFFIKELWKVIVLFNILIQHLLSSTLGNSHGSKNKTAYISLLCNGFVSAE